MLKILLVLHALCGPENPEAICSVKWKYYEERGAEAVLITGYNGSHFTICEIINTAEADCYVTMASPSAPAK